MGCVTFDFSGGQYKARGVLPQPSMWELLPVLIVSVLAQMLPVLWPLPFLLLLPTPLRLHRIVESDKVTRVLRTLRSGAVFITNDQPSGFVCGRWFVSFVREYHTPRGGRNTEVFVLATESQYKELLGSATDLSEAVAKRMTIWERKGDFFGLRYSSRELEFDFTSTPQQKRCIEQIQGRFRMNHHVCAMLYGEAGCGKSMVGRLLAQKMGGHFCDSWNPADPGDLLSVLWEKAGPTKAQPLVVVLEEFNVLLHAAHENRIKPHKHIPIPVRDKTRWNAMLDHLAIGMWPNLILILTSNVTPETINEWDSSYIREGRVDIKLNMTEEG